MFELIEILPSCCHECEHFRFFFFLQFLYHFFLVQWLVLSLRRGKWKIQVSSQYFSIILYVLCLVRFHRFHRFHNNNTKFLLPRSVLSWTSLPHSVIPFRLSFWFILFLIGSYVWTVDGIYIFVHCRKTISHMLNRFLSSILSNSANAVERGEYVYLQFQANWNREFISNASLFKSLATVVWVMSSAWMHIPTAIIDGFPHTQWRFKYTMQFCAERKSIDGIYYSIDTCCSTFYALDFYVLRFARHKIFIPWRHWMRQCAYKMKITLRSCTPANRSHKSGPVD